MVWHESENTKVFLPCDQGLLRKACDPSLSISGQSIPFIGSNIITFLGGPISVPVGKQDHQMKLKERVVQLLEKVDGTGVSRKQKLLQEFALVLLGILG